MELESPALGSEKFSSIEFDTTHGVSLDDPSQPLTLYFNSRRAIDALNQRFKVIMTIVTCGFTILLMMPGSELIVNPGRQNAKAALLVFSVFAILYSMTLALAYLYSIRHFQKPKGPIIEMRPEGLRIQSPGIKLDLVPWADIKEARAHTLFPFRMLGIVPNSFGRVLRYASFCTRLAIILESAAAWTLNLFGLSATPLSVQEDWLPLNADEIATLINSRRDYYVDLGNTASIAAFDRCRTNGQS